MYLEPCAACCMQLAQTILPVNCIRSFIIAFFLQLLHATLVRVALLYVGHARSVLLKINLILLSTYNPLILAPRPRFENHTYIIVDIYLRLLFGRFGSGCISNFISERTFREKLLETKFVVVYKLLAKQTYPPLESAS